MGKINRVGEEFINYQGCKFKIIEYINSLNCTIQFEDGNIFYKKDYGAIRKGKVKNLFFPSVYGVGYIGQGKYKLFKNKKPSPATSFWYNMLSRSYSEKYHKTHPTYKDVKVCEEWHNFQNFAKWYEENWKPYMDGWHLDKDILFKGNKIYSPETCCFVPHEVNMVGILIHKTINDMFLTNKSVYDVVYRKVYKGTFINKEEALKEFKKEVRIFLKTIIVKYKGLIGNRIITILKNY